MKLDIQKFAGTINFGTITENDPTMIDLNWGVFVAKHSYVNIPVSRSGTHLIGAKRLRLYIRYSTTSSYRVFEQSFPTPVDNFNVTFSDCPITASGTINIQVDALDPSSQKIGSQSTTITAKAYSNPRITNAIAKRVNSSNVESPNGEYLNYTFEGTIDSVSNHNAHTFRIGYRETGTPTYTYANVETSSYTCSKTNIFVPGWHLDAGKEYDIVFEAIDSFTTQSAIRNIESGFDLMNFNASGLAMAIGKVSSAGANEALFEVGMDTNIDGDLDITKNVAQIQHNGTNFIGNLADGRTIISANNGTIYIRPKGYGDINGQMTLENNGNLSISGRINLGTNGFKTLSPAGYTTDQYGNFHHQQATASDEWQLYDYSGYIKLQFIWETGELKVNGGKVYSAYELYTGDDNVGPITLSDSVANYDHIDIVFRSNDGVGYKSTRRIYTPISGAVTDLELKHSTGSTIYTKWTEISISGSSISFWNSFEYYFSVGSSSTIATSSANNIYILKVIGYK